jgi:serine/threonine-protein kinase
MTLTPGTKLGPYEIVAPLGAGGMGEVYRARDRKLDRDVAIKVLPNAVATDRDRLARFEREAKILASLSHSNIAQVFGLEVSGDASSNTSAIVMELVEGHDLSELIARGPLPIAEALSVARQIAEALEAAHEQGVIHRDLKPGNIKVRHDGSVKVLDFGLAKAVESATASSGAPNSPTITSPAMTHAGVVLGTAAYMAPEQAKGKAIDRRADIWAFGAVLYEMLTGSRAFPGEDVTDAIVSIMSREPDWSRLPAETPSPIRMLLKRMLDKDAKRRLRDVGEARLVFDDVLYGRAQPVEAQPAPVARSPVWRRLMPVAATAIVVATVAYGAWRMTPTPPMPIVRFTITLPENFEFTRTAARMIDVSRDGAQIVYLGNRQLHLRSLSTNESRPLAATLDPATPFFSPDGQWIAFLSVGESAIKKVAVAGGASVRLCSMPTGVGMFQGGAWEGDWIYFAQNGRGILRVSANGGEPEVVAPVDANQFVYGPAFLPGGRTFLMAITADTSANRWDLGEIVAYTPSTAARKTILRGGGAPRYLRSGALLYATDSTVLAVPFDTSRLEVTGPPVTVLENVRRAVNAPSGAAQFAVSESGIIAYLTGSAVDLRLATLALAPIAGDGRLRPLPVSPARYTAPKVSPDGRHIAVTINDETGSAIWVGNLAPPSPLRRLTAGPRDRAPHWSADSRFVIFMADTPQPGVYRQTADGSAPAEPVTTGSQVGAGEAVHPDGKTIAFSQGNDVDLWIVSGGSKPQPLVTRPGTQRYMTFSPDGRYFAYTSRTDGGSDIVVEPFPPNGAIHRLSTGGGTGPRWSPTGTDIYYQPDLGATGFGQGTIRRLPVRTTPTFSIVGPPAEVPIGMVSTAMFQNFDITPDGRYALVILAGRSADGESRSAPQEIHVVINWLEEVRAKMPRR